MTSIKNSVSNISKSETKSAVTGKGKKQSVDTVNKPSPSFKQFETNLRQAWLLGQTIKREKKKTGQIKFDQLLQKTTVLPQKRGLENIERKLCTLLNPYLQFIVTAIHDKDYMKVSKILDIRNILENINNPKMLGFSGSRGKLGLNQKKPSSEVRSRNLASRGFVTEMSKRKDSSSQQAGRKDSASSERMKPRMDLNVVNLSHDSSLQPIQDIQSITPQNRKTEKIAEYANKGQQRSVTTPYKSKITEYHENLADFVRGLKIEQKQDQKRRLSYYEQQQELLLQNKNLDQFIENENQRLKDEKKRKDKLYEGIENALKNPTTEVYRNSDIENWIRNETKNTIVALESFIKLCSNNQNQLEGYTSDEDNFMRQISTGLPFSKAVKKQPHDDQITQPSRSHMTSAYQQQQQHQNSIISGRNQDQMLFDSDQSQQNMTPTANQVYINKQMRGKALKAIPKQSRQQQQIRPNNRDLLKYSGKPGFSNRAQSRNQNSSIIKNYIVNSARRQSYPMQKSIIKNYQGSPQIRQQALEYLNTDPTPDLFSKNINPFRPNSSIQEQSNSIMVQSGAKKYIEPLPQGMVQQNSTFITNTRESYQENIKSKKYLNPNNNTRYQTINVPNRNFQHYVNSRSFHEGNEQQEEEQDDDDDDDEENKSTSFIPNELLPKKKSRDYVLPEIAKRGGLNLSINIPRSTDKQSRNQFQKMRLESKYNSNVKSNKYFGITSQSNQKRIQLIQNGKITEVPSQTQSQTLTDEPSGISFDISQLK